MAVNAKISGFWVVTSSSLERVSCFGVTYLLHLQGRRVFSFGATAPIWTLAYLHETPFHFGFLDLRQSVGLLGRMISSSQGLPVHKHYTSMP
jgi:hypothetical protein